jgi:hypothetical protein
MVAQSVEELLRVMVVVETLWVPNENEVKMFRRVKLLY